MFETCNVASNATQCHVKHFVRVMVYTGGIVTGAWCPGFVCPSVRLSVTLYIVSRWLKISSNVFLSPVAPSF